MATPLPISLALPGAIRGNECAAVPDVVRSNSVTPAHHLGLTLSFTALACRCVAPAIAARSAARFLLSEPRAPEYTVGD